MKQPLLSIVIPTLNRADSVDRLLNSLLKQNFELDRLEIIVAMNIFDPDQDKRIKEWSGRLNIQGFATGELGVNQARNLGIDQSKAEIILLLDDDMQLLDPEILKRHLKYHEDPALMALGGSWAMPSGSSIPALAYHIIGSTWMYRYRKEDGRTCYLLGGHASYKRSLFEKFHFNNQIKFGASETEFNLRLHNAGLLMKYAPEIRSVHHNDVKTRNFLRKAYLQGFNGALRKETLGVPKPVTKHSVALEAVNSVERPALWQKPFLNFHYWLYTWGSKEGEKAALGKSSERRKRFVRWLAQA